MKYWENIEFSNELSMNAHTFGVQNVTTSQDYFMSVTQKQFPRCVILTSFHKTNPTISQGRSPTQSAKLSLLGNNITQGIAFILLCADAK